MREVGDKAFGALPSEHANVFSKAGICHEYLSAEKKNKKKGTYLDELLILEVTILLFLRGPLNPSLQEHTHSDSQEQDFHPSADTGIKAAQAEGSRRSRGGPGPGGATRTALRPRDSRALTGVVEGDLPAPGCGPGAVIHRSSFHDVWLRGVGFGSSHQDTDPVEHTGRSPGRPGRAGDGRCHPAGSPTAFPKRSPGPGRPGPVTPGGGTHVLGSGM